VNAELSSDKPNPYTREPAVMDYLSLSTYRKELTAAREHLSQPKSSAGASAIHKTDALSSIVHYLGSQDASDRNSAFALDSTLRISYFVDTMDKLLEEANNRISTLEISSAVKRYRDYDRKHTAEVLLVASDVLIKSSCNFSPGREPTILIFFPDISENNSAQYSSIK
jgi:hypothetical protein